MFKNDRQIKLAIQSIMVFLEDDFDVIISLAKLTFRKKNMCVNLPFCEIKTPKLCFPFIFKRRVKFLAILT